MMISFTFLLVLVEYTAKFTRGLTTFDNILLVGNPKLAEIQYSTFLVLIKDIFVDPGEQVPSK